MGSTSVWTDPGCIELVIADGSSSASTVVRRATLTVLCVLGGAWPGRSTVQLAVGKCTRSVQQQPTGCHSQRIGEKDQLHVQGGLSGNPVRRERGRTPSIRVGSKVSGAS